MSNDKSYPYLLLSSWFIIFIIWGGLLLPIVDTGNVIGISIYFGMLWGNGYFFQEFDRNNLRDNLHDTMFIYGFGMIIGIIIPWLFFIPQIIAFLHSIFTKLPIPIGGIFIILALINFSLVMIGKYFPLWVHWYILTSYPVLIYELCIGFLMIVVGLLNSTLFLFEFPKNSLADADSFNYGRSVIIICLSFILQTIIQSNGLVTLENANGKKILIFLTNWILLGVYWDFIYDSNYQIVNENLFLSLLIPIVSLITMILVDSNPKKTISAGLMPFMYYTIPGMLISAVYEVGTKVFEEFFSRSIIYVIIYNIIMFLLIIVTLTLLFLTNTAFNERNIHRLTNCIYILITCILGTSIGWLTMVGNNNYAVGGLVISNITFIYMLIYYPIRD